MITRRLSYLGLLTSFALVGAAYADTGIPSFVYFDDPLVPTIRVRGSGATLNGFRQYGSYHRLTGPSLSLAISPTEWPINSSTVPGFTIPSPLASNHPDLLNVNVNQYWIAVFLVANGSQCEVRFVPFLRVTALLTPGIRYSTHGGAATTVNGLAGREIQVCTENGFLAGRVTTILSNNAPSGQVGELTLSSQGDIAPGDYLLPAPAVPKDGLSHFKYIGTLKVDRPYSLQLRNFAQSGRMMLSRTWSYFHWPNTSLVSFSPGAVTTVDFREHIGPLASGVIFNAGVWTTATGGAGTFMIDHDGSDHALAMFGLRIPSAPSGSVVRSNAIVAFSKRPIMYGKFENGNSGVAADIFIQGWMED